VNEDTLTTTQLSNAPWLEYIIRFQNTGNDTAFTVKILNPIDTNKLNLSTFEFTNASHPVNLNWINYQRNMEFKFENILLVTATPTNPSLMASFVIASNPKQPSPPAIPSPTSLPSTSTSTNLSSLTRLKPSSFSPPELHLQLQHKENCMSSQILQRIQSTSPVFNWRMGKRC
jgi:hypothetical protein